ncbi:MAG: TIGR04283 family arsenosugar biosynthesis glycosyltransferase [Deltaproteobacteria bacterium]|nr:TIGR04283 family arsenosugar biosynthesis glycosyltransferase [Deltaproteobacteria bacterium]
MILSVIIPALNESACIREAVSRVGPFEIIVSDGGSADGTTEIARGLGLKVIEGKRGRGCQMDEAARIAKGEVLLFLHADTMLPNGWFEAIERALDDKRNVAGAFTLSFDSGELWFRFTEAVIRWRCRLLGLIYGDQAIFIRREAFFKAGGFNKLPLMEDVDCVKRLRKLGRVALLKEKVVTSRRKYRGGVLFNSLRNGLILSLYYAGVSPDRLYSIYYKNR